MCSAPVISLRFPKGWLEAQNLGSAATEAKESQLEKWGISVGDANKQQRYNNQDLPLFKHIFPLMTEVITNVTHVLWR